MAQADNILMKPLNLAVVLLYLLYKNKQWMLVIQISLTGKLEGLKRMTWDKLE